MFVDPAATDGLPVPHEEIVGAESCTMPTGFHSMNMI
jgi:hypothetical protein